METPNARSAIKLAGSASKGLSAGLHLGSAPTMNMSPFAMLRSWWTNLSWRIQPAAPATSTRRAPGALATQKMSEIPLSVLMNAPLAAVCSSEKFHDAVDELEASLQRCTCGGRASILETRDEEWFCGCDSCDRHTAELSRPDFAARAWENL